MDLQDSVQFDSALPDPRRSGLSSSSIDMILGGALSSAQQQLERAFQGLREKSEELESALEQAVERNRQLEEQNAKLLSESRQARDRAVRLEAAARLAMEQTNTILMGLTDALSAEPDGPPEGGARETREPGEEASDVNSSMDAVDDGSGLLSEEATEQPESSTEEESSAPESATSGMLSTGGVPGMTHLVASPFDSLAAVLRFQREVKQLAGVTEVKPVEFDDGVLRLAVWYSSEMTHLGSLLGLTGYDLRLETPVDDASDACVASSNGSTHDLGRRAS